MKFEQLDRRMRVYETAHDHCVLPGVHMVARIDGALLVNKADSMAKVLAWPKETRILVHCHHGIRSLDAVAYLRERGFEQAQSVAGGIDAWSTRVDRTVPRY